MTICALYLVFCNVDWDCLHRLAHPVAGRWPLVYVLPYVLTSRRKLM